MDNLSDYQDAFGLARTLAHEYNYETRVEGIIPPEIKGTLYRNGPGLFERNGYRKNNILDGDGMVQSFHFVDGKVYYKNKFVRTEKFVKETEAEKYLYGTWTTRAPGGIFKNWFHKGMPKNQAGVSTKVFNGQLYAFDESQYPYLLDPNTLNTIKETDLGVKLSTKVQARFSAHPKLDPSTGEWIHFGMEYGRQSFLQLYIFDSKGTLKRGKRLPLPRQSYMHDFFVTDNYMIFLLQPAEMNPLSVLFGLKSFAESLQWHSNKGGAFMVVHKNMDQEPLYFECESIWMWHSLNAYEKKDELLAYFIGYDDPDHFIGPHAQTYEIMKDGADPDNLSPTIHPGLFRFASINLKNKKVHIHNLHLSDEFTYEFPMVNPQLQSKDTTYGYASRNDKFGVLHSQICRMNVKSAQITFFDFGPANFCGEPIFVPKPGFTYSHGSYEEPGWLLSLVFNEFQNKSFLALLDAEHIEDGPLARIHLDHHTPISFHGFWEPE